MDTMTAGANASSKTASVATSMMNGVQKAMDSSSDLVFKMQTLLKKEEARKVQEQLQTQKLIQDQFQFGVQQKFRDRKLAAQETQWEAGNKLEGEKIQLNKDKFEVQKPMWEAQSENYSMDTKVKKKKLELMEGSVGEAPPSTLTPPKAPDETAYKSEVKLLNDKATQMKQGWEKDFNEGRMSEEQYIDSVDNLDKYLDTNTKSQVSKTLSTKYDTQQAQYEQDKMMEEIRNMKSEAGSYKNFGLAYPKQGKLDELTAKVTTQAETAKQVLKDQPTQKEIANKIIEVAKTIATEEGIPMDEAMIQAKQSVGNAYSMTGAKVPASLSGYTPVGTQNKGPNLTGKNLDNMYTKPAKIGNKIALRETRKTRQVMDSIPTEQGKSQYAKSHDVIKLGTQLTRMNSKEAYKQYEHLTDGMPQKTKEIYDNAVFRNTLANSGKVFLGKDGQWHGKFDTDYKQGEAMDFKVKTMNDNTSTDVFRRLKSQVGGTGYFMYGMESLIAGAGFDKSHEWKNLSGSKKMRKFDEATSKGKEYAGVTPYTTIGAYSEGMNEFADNTKSWGVDFTLGLMGESLNEAGEKIYKGKVTKADGTEGTLAPFFINSASFVEGMEKARPKGGLIEAPEKTWATGGSMLDAFNPNSKSGTSNQPMSAKEAREKFKKYNKSLNPVQRKAVADNSIALIRALQQYADNAGIIVEGKVAVDHPDDVTQTLYLNNLETGNTEEVKMSIKDIYLASIAMFGGIVDK